MSKGIGKRFWSTAKWSWTVREKRSEAQKRWDKHFFEEKYLFHVWFQIAYCTCYLFKNDFKKIVLKDSPAVLVLDKTSLHQIQMFALFFLLSPSLYFFKCSSYWKRRRSSWRAPRRPTSTSSSKMSDDEIWRIVESVFNLRVYFLDGQKNSNNSHFKYPMTYQWRLFAIQTFSSWYMYICVLKG